MRKIIASLFLLIAPVLAQSFTTVTGTVTDPNGLPYANGTIATNIVISNTPFFSGTQTQYFQPSQPSGLDGNGKFLLRLADVTQLTPGGATYTFTTCSFQGTVLPSFGKGSRCFTVTGVSISGTSQDITATLTAAALPLTATFGPGSGCGSGTTGQIMFFSASTTCSGISNFTTNGANVINLTGTGKFGTYDGLGSFGNSIAQTVGLTQGLAFTGNMSAVNLLTTPSTGTTRLFLRVSCYFVIQLAAATSSTLPSCQVSWTDFTTGTVETATFSPTSNANTVGTFVQGSIFISPATGTNINVSSTGYASNPAATMSWVNGFVIESM